ncbi:MAG: tetratricopeptide repeat protein, partial [Myxococcales bacterium]|nr:tetratricopeptide repeat protein [Myxococcales bacterium]
RSAADPPLDWGDPETPLRLWEHLTASRIRAAYEGEILSADAGARAGIELLGQLLELAALLPLGMLGWLALRRGPGRRFGLLASLLFGLDLAYARWINPMGVADRQVGHLAAAMLALLAGCGLAASLHHVRTRWGPSIARPLGLGAALLAIVLLIGPGAPPHGEAAGELFGAGGSLLDLPPRAILLCRSDDLCAGGLFAIHAEGARPDLSVAPAQHLWEPTVRAPLRAASGALEAVGSSRPAGQRERAELAAALERALLLESARPVLLEVEGDGSLGLAAPRSPPYWAPRAQAGSPAPALEGLERRYRTRREEAARDPRVNAGWARAYGEVGRQALAAAELGVAVAAFRRALVIAPERSVGWSNLGVALARAGDLEGAIEASASAVRIAPSRAIGWLNLARFLAASGRLEQARATLQRARGAGIDDPRLEAFESSLRSARPAPGLP